MVFLLIVSLPQSRTVTTKYNNVLPLKIKNNYEDESILFARCRAYCHGSKR